MEKIKLDKLREVLPEGTRVVLISMEDIRPVAPGTRGTVEHVDDMGNVHVLWDDRRALSAIPCVDRFRILTEKELLLENAYKAVLAFLEIDPLRDGDFSECDPAFEDVLDEAKNFIDAVDNLSFKEGEII